MRTFIVRRTTSTAFFLLLFSLLPAAADGQGNVFDRVRYNGGTFSTKVSPKDWDNQLTVASDRITFRLKDGQEIQIVPPLVTSVSYGQEAHRRVGSVLGVIVTPLSLLGLHRETRLYFIGMQYSSPKGEKAGLLLQGNKDNYRGILQALQSVTGLTIAVSESDRSDVPVGLKTSVSSPAEPPSAQKDARLPPEAAAQYGSLVITSDPPGGDVTMDGAFIGNTPASVDLVVGPHTIRVSARGYKDWSREINVLVRSKLTLAATLEKQD